MKAVGLIGLGAGVLVVLTGFFMTPDFLATHFDFVGTLDEWKIQQIQLYRRLAAFIGTLAVVFGALYLICPSRVNRFFAFVSHVGGRGQTRYFYLPFCFICFLIALILGLSSTQSGPGISADSTYYIFVGENLYYGGGFYIPFYDATLTAETPLYPLSIAAFMHLGFDAEQAARLIPILCFASLMFPLFFLGKITNDVFTGYVVCLICLVFMRLLWIASYAWTEMLYTFLSVLVILFLTKFAESNEGKNKTLCVAGLFTALACLTRYIGVTLLLVGLIVIVLKNKSRLKKAASQILLFGSISCLPIIPWLYRNIILTSNLQGFAVVPSEVGLLDNINLTVATILGGYSVGQLSHLYSYAYIGLVPIIVATCFIVIYVKTHSAEKKVWLRYLGKNYVTISYTLIYLISYIIIRSNLFHGVSHRDLCPVYPFLTLVVISFIFYAYSRIEKPSLKPTLFSIINISCALFLVFQASISLHYWQDAKNGLGYNAPFWRNSQAIAWVASNVPDDGMVYSSKRDAISFRLKRPARFLPRSGNEREIEEFFEELKNEENSFIICFKKNRRAGLLSNSEIREINQKYDVLVVVADFPEATIWRVRRWQP